MSKRNKAEDTAAASRKQIDLKLFVKVWTMAASVEEVAEKLGVSKATVYTTRKRLVNAGVDLKTMRRTSIDVDELNAIIRETVKP